MYYCHICDNNNNYLSPFLLFWGEKKALMQKILIFKDEERPMWNVGNWLKCESAPAHSWLN